MNAQLMPTHNSGLLKKSYKGPIANMNHNSPELMAVRQKLNSLRSQTMGPQR